VAAGGKPQIMMVGWFLNNFILRVPLAFDFSAWYVNGAIWGSLRFP
jgi:hypothetical protein